MERRMNLPFILALRPGIAGALSPANQTVLASAMHPAVDIERVRDFWQPVDFLQFFARRGKGHSLRPNP